MRRNLLVLSLVVIAGVLVMYVAGPAGVLGTAAGLLLGAGVGFLVLFTAARRSLPRTQGTFRVHGLTGPVEVIRDVDAVPHVYASDRADAWFGLGWVHAQDRLWQMEWGRRIVRGRVAELLGRRALPLDRFMRTLGIHRAAEPAWERLPGPAREAVEAYVAGINACLRETGRRLPPEFGVLRARPEPWTPGDVVAAAKMMAWALGGSYVTELLRGDLERALGPERTGWLLPDRDQTAARPSHAEGTAGGLSGSCLTELSDSLPVLPGEGIGTNLWAVSPARSTTGAAVLANDPHLPASTPGTWYVAHLSAGGLDAIGATLPGIPAVIMGRNREIAWGVANLNPDVQDLFAERLDEDGARAEFRGEWEPVRRIREVIRVRKGADVEWTVRITRHGPLLSDALNANGKEPGGAREPLALQWTGLDADDPSLAALLAVSEADSWERFIEALRPYAAPPAVFGFADTAGNIGYHAAGRVPVRVGGDGSRPAEGWSGAHEWSGWIPFDELPQAHNPPEGFVVSANAVPEGYTGFLGRDWVEPYREHRIREMIRAADRLSPEEHVRIQGDTLSSAARSLLPLLLACTRPEDERSRDVLARLAGWDGDARADGAEGAVFAAWIRHLVRSLLPEELDPKVAAVYESWPTYTGRYLAAVLKREAPTARAPEDLALDALRAALDDLARRMGPDPDRWKWGRVHRALFPHQPLHAVRPLRRWLSRSVPTGGDWSSVNLGSVSPASPYLQRNIAGYRQVVDLSHLDGGRFIHAPGQAGHPLSPHYDDYLSDWAAVRFRPLRLERASVEAAAAATLRLEPTVPS